MTNDIAGKIPQPFHPISRKFLDIGGVILSYMEEKRIDGATLSRLSGVSESEVYNVLKNRRTHAGLKTLSKLVEPLGKTLADVFVKLSYDQEGNVRKLDKDPAFTMEFKKQGVTIFSEIPAAPEFFIGRVSLLAGAKGLSSHGLKEHCWVFLRVTRGGLEVDYCGRNYPLSTYQKIVFNAKYPYAVSNKSGRDLAEALLVTTPSLWTLTSA